MIFRNLRSLLYGIAIFISVLILIAIYRYADPLAAWMPKCPVYMLTELKCPGCGTQRALHSLFTGDLASAWHYNAALICFIPILILLGISALTRRRYPRLYASLNSSIVAAICGILLIAWGILRNPLNL